MEEANQKVLYKNSNVSLIISRILAYLLLIFLSALCLFTFVILIINASRTNAQIQRGFSFFFGKHFFINLKVLLDNDNMPILSALKNSLIISASTSILSVYFSSMTAYAVHAYNFKFKKTAYAFILLIMMIPSQVSSAGFIQLVYTMKLNDTFYPLILPAISAPIIVFFMKQYMDSVLPYDMIEAARIDGASEIRTFHTMILPILKPAIAVQIIFAFVSSWNNFYIPGLVIETMPNRTIPLLINELRSGSPETFDLGQVYMLITFAIVPILIVYLALSKFIIRGITLGSVKG